MNSDQKFVDKAIVISTIAMKNLSITTLDTQNNDQLDFHDLSVNSIKNALYEAYETGYRAAMDREKRRND